MQEDIHFLLNPFFLKDVLGCPDRHPEAIRWPAVEALLGCWFWLDRYHQDQKPRKGIRQWGFELWLCPCVIWTCDLSLALQFGHMWNGDTLTDLLWELPEVVLTGTTDTFCVHKMQATVTAVSSRTSLVRLCPVTTCECGKLPSIYSTCEVPATMLYASHALSSFLPTPQGVFTGPATHQQLTGPETHQQLTGPATQQLTGPATHQSHPGLWQTPNLNLSPWPSPPGSASLMRSPRGSHEW